MVGSKPIAYGEEVVPSARFIPIAAAKEKIRGSRSESRSGSYICAANVHMCMEAYRDNAFQAVVNKAEMVVPDGKPLIWWMRSFKVREAQQVRGPDLFLSVCEKASQRDIPIALYGASQGTLDRLCQYLKLKYANLSVVCAISPPFKPISENEQDICTYFIRRFGVP